MLAQNQVARHTPERVLQEGVLDPGIRDAKEVGRIADRYTRPSYDTLNYIRPVCGNGDACLLCAGSAEPMVHPGVCWSLRARVGLRFSAGSVAVRIGGSNLGDGSGATMVAGKIRVACR